MEHLEESDARMSPFDFRIQKPFTGLSDLCDVVAQAIDLHGCRRVESAP